MNNNFEYILSGLTFLRIDRPDIWSTEYSNKWMNEKFGMMNTMFPNQKFGLLYNAFDQRDAPLRLYLKKHCIENISNVFADSGGLQMMTRNIQLTDEIKEKIYTRQSEFSTKAMLFDVIPITTVGNTSAINSVKTRQFDRTKLIEAASQTGKNLKGQIEFFLKHNSDSHPIMIVHGNCLETYKIWTETILKEIPKKWHKHIGGIASGGGALGNGTLEDIKRSFYLSQIPFVNEHKHFHILGVGSINRLLPYIIFSQNGLFQNKNISYDSTTHSKGVAFGCYQDVDQIPLMSFPRYVDDIKWPKIHQRVIEMMGPQPDLELFNDCMYMRKKEYVKRFNEYVSQTVTISAFVLTSVINFMDILNKTLHDKAYMLSLLHSNSNYLAYEQLYNVKNETDFNHWENHVGKYMQSSPVDHVSTRSLEDFF